MAIKSALGARLETCSIDHISINAITTIIYLFKQLSRRIIMAGTREEILKSFTFGVQFEFLVDRRGTLFNDIWTDSEDPSTTVEGVALVIKEHLEAIQLTYPVSVSNHLDEASRAERAEDELEYRHWIIRGRDSIGARGDSSETV